MAQPLEFWFEFASTYSFPAAMRVEAACDAASVALVWKPFLLGPVFAAQGLKGSPFEIYPIKGAYMLRDMERICADAGLDFRKPSTFPRGSLLGARIAAVHAGAPWVGQFIRAVYEANFSADRDIAQPEVIFALLKDMGLDPEAVTGAATTEDAKTLLRTNTEEAGARGLFGAPSMTVGAELFWGHDRLDRAIAWARDT